MPSAEHNLPRKVEVLELVSSRYQSGKRPLSWDERAEGADVIKTKEGEVLKLVSEGGQSPPQQGWVLMLRDGDAARGYSWTLYGLSRQSH